MNNSYNNKNRNMEQLQANCNNNTTSGSNKRDQTSTPDPKRDPENLSNTNNNMDDALQLQQQEAHLFAEDLDSTCSTPYVSAPSSPGHNGPINGGFFYSCPASPMHFAITSTAAAVKASYSSSSSAAADEFEFSARFGSSGSDQPGSMSSADELFLNGQIRPMKLSSHLERPQVLAPLLDLENEEEEDNEGKSYYESARGRDLRVVRDKSLRRRTRSMSPFRTTSFEFVDDDDEDNGNTHKGKNVKNESCGGSLQVCDESIIKIEEEASSSSTTTTPSVSASSSRSSSAGRNSKRWVFLKDFLYRSKSEGRSNNKFWSNISFSPAKEKGTGKSTSSTAAGSVASAGVTKDKGSNGSSSVGVMEGSSQKVKGGSGSGGQSSGKKPVNGVGKKKVPTSPHELHYKASRAQAEEMRKKTYLPYRQGLLGCLGFSSKGYGAMNGIARALNPVSSR